VGGTQLLASPVQVALATDAGRDPAKQVNEDSCRQGATAFGHLVVVCDGMGGHEGGRDASMRAIETVFRYVDVAPVRGDIPAAVRVREVLRDAIGVANREVHALGAGRPSHARPGSTIVAALVHSLGTEIAHVGDSRCYLVHDGQVRQLTRDHSMVQQLVLAGRLSEEQAAAHPEANKITRALGMSAGVEVEFQQSIVHTSGDVLVLCSDGLSDVVSMADILAVVSAGPVARAAQDLVDLANRRGGPDNVTVALVRIGESAPVAPPSSSPSAPGSRARLTESMPAYVAAGHVAMALADTVAPGTATAPPRPDAAASAPESRPLLPPAPPSKRPRKRGGAGVLLGGAALVATVGAGAVLLLTSGAGSDGKEVTGPALPIVLPSAALEQASVPDDLDAMTPDAGARVRRVHNKSRK
jgi:protein phosphatase